MSVRDTSLEVYHRKVLPSLGDKQRQVLQVFRNNPFTDHTNMEVAYVLGWSINRVTPRTLELRKKGFLQKCERRQCRITKNNAYSWRLTEEGSVRYV